MLSSKQLLHIHRLSTTVVGIRKEYTGEEALLEVLGRLSLREWNTARLTPSRPSGRGPFAPLKFITGTQVNRLSPSFQILISMSTAISK